MRGDLLLGVDVSRVRLDSVDPRARTAVAVLPPPDVISPRVDHEGSRIFAVTENGLWQLVPGDAAQAAAVNEGLAAAQALVARAGRDPALGEAARRHAEQSIGSFYRALDWQVSVRWTGSGHAAR